VIYIYNFPDVFVLLVNILPYLYLQIIYCDVLFVSLTLLDVSYNCDVQSIMLLWI
jgi:hypothetical protein